MADTQRDGDFDYETHGRGYALQRRTDPRIAAAVHAGLGQARAVLNVGAGAGSYEPPDRYVVAVEPSPVMRAQRPAGRPAIAAAAENLPFDDGAFDAVMATITVHQWSDVERGLSEMRRVATGPVVILTFDGDALDRFWLADYVPELMVAERGRYPAISRLTRALGEGTVVQDVPVPIDCVDGFTEAYFARPERFLDDRVRQAQSAWGFVHPDVQARGVERLRDDLASGAWDARYGHLRTLPAFDGSLRLIVGPDQGSP